MNDDKPAHNTIALAPHSTPLRRALSVDVVRRALEMGAVDIGPGSRLMAATGPTGSGNTYKHPRIEGNKMRCRIFKSDEGPLRKLTQRSDGRQVLMPASKVKVTGKPMTRQERRLIELEIRRAVKKARKAAP